MPSTTPSKSEFSRRLSTSARRREFEFAVSQWGQCVVGNHGEVAVDIEHRQQEVVGNVSNGDNEDEASHQDPRALATDIGISDGGSLRRKIGVVVIDARSPKRKKDDGDNAHILTATTFPPPRPATPHPNTNTPYQRHTSGFPRIIKDVTSTPEREQALFYYGTEESPVGETTGIFSPRVTLTLNNQEIPSPVLLKERHVYVPNKRKLTGNSETQGPESQLDPDKAMPFKTFGWSLSRKSTSAQSSANSTPESSQKRTVDRETHPQGIRLTTLSAKLKALRIENINKSFVQQNGDPDTNVDKAIAPLAQNNQDSPPKFDSDVLQSVAMEITTGGAGDGSSSVGEHTVSNKLPLPNGLPMPSLEPANTEAERIVHTLISEKDGASENSCLDLVVGLADAYATDLGVAEAELLSGSSPTSPEDMNTPDSHPTKLLNFETDRYIQLLDKHDIARAEEMAARAVITKYTLPTKKSGNFSFGEQLAAKGKKAKLKTLRDNFARYINGMDITGLEKGHTITAWKRTWNEHLLSSGAALIEINRGRDIRACFQNLVEAKGDHGDESAKEFLRLMSQGQIDMEKFMAQVDEEEARSKQRHQQRQAQDGIEPASQQDQVPGSVPNRPWPNLHCTLDWKPVGEGWISHDGKYECIQAGAIPKFAYRENQAEIEAPDAPKTIWLRATSSDDEHINEDISFKILGLEDNWKASPTGMYMSRIDDDDDSDSDQSDIGWSSRLLNHRLMLTCNSVNGSNVDLSYDPEELDIPTMDTNRHFAKMDCTLTLQYPNYVKTERKFNRMGEMVAIPPPVRKDKIPRRSCMKSLSQLRRTRRGRPIVRVEKWAKFKLMPEERDTSAKFHPRQSSWAQKKQFLLRKAFREQGLFEMLPSVRAQHTRIRGFEQYYPRFLQPPTSTQVCKTISYGAGYMLNHIARFKLGLPTLEDGKTRVKIRNALKKVIEHRKNGQSRHEQNKPYGFMYKIFNRAQRRRIRPPNSVLDREVNLVGNFRTRGRAQGAYMVYWRVSKKRNADEKEDGDWVDLLDEEYLDEEPAGD
ncbi:uncharacterized protein DFL_008460 [Arthrobotrys flagrans]|uniref:Uncharacterized protein n=1 Tax=Arthrobotrys flagrans TaxID=97331 RepID=A0A436ZNV6_ARTFL|nr:hypothetical protein DFL_008460 [Arthrobotrys flagrans]